MYVKHHYQEKMLMFSFSKSIHFLCPPTNQTITPLINYKVSQARSSQPSLITLPVRRPVDSTPYALQGRHHEHYGAWNHWRPDCLLKRLSRRRSKKISKLRVTGFCEGNPLVTGGLPSYKVPVTRKMFPFDDVIIYFFVANSSPIKPIP